jgi:predicted secreted Zn-dependent protease
MERAWYLANCNAPPQPAPVLVSTPVQAAFSATPAPVTSCPTDVTVNTNFTREYFDVAGANLDEINASLRANAPSTEDGPASGLTEYRMSLATGRCVGTGICKLGAALVGASGRVILPRHTAAASLSNPVLQVWNRFVRDVTVHEERHVTIVKEGLEEARRSLLAIPSQPNCEELDRVVAETWNNAVTSVDQRQDAFHVADRYGVGGAVVQ